MLLFTLGSLVNDTMNDQRQEREHKFVFNDADAAGFLSAFEGRLARIEYDASRPEAWTRTTYLDTDEFTYLRSSATHTHRRLRVREYASAAPGGEPALSGLCYLELKENTGSYRSKVRCAAPAAEIAALLRGSIPAGPSWTVRTHAAWITLLKRIIEERPSPRVTTWYRRETFAIPSGRVRLTVDRDISICEPVEPGSGARPPRTMEQLAATIVEVKVQGPNPEWLTPILAASTETHGFSKFHRAMESVAGKLAVRGGAR